MHSELPLSVDLLYGLSGLTTDVIVLSSIIHNNGSTLYNNIYTCH